MATATRFLRVAAALGAAGAAAAGAPAGDAAMAAQFEEYLSHHGKRYTGAEWHERFANFRQSLHAIERHATKNRSHRLHLNELADMGGAEFSRYQLGLRARPRRVLASRASPQKAGETAGPLGASLLPLSVDWRERGKVNDPRQQYGCGACWTFASSSALASAWGIASGVMVNVSQQQLLDCAGEEYGNGGCDGGAFDGTYRYAETVPLCTAESYPYHASQSLCHSSLCEVGIPQGAVQGFVDVEPGSEAALMEAVAKQPVTVGIMVREEGPGLRLYEGGIFSGDCTSAPNHAVVVVGYGTEGGQDYWLLQNSWGARWGEGGYFRLARGSGPDGVGECGILSMPAYPVVEVPAAATTTVDEQWATTAEPGPAASAVDFLI